MRRLLGRGVESGQGSGREGVGRLLGQGRRLKGKVVGGRGERGRHLGVEDGEDLEGVALDLFEGGAGLEQGGLPLAAYGHKHRRRHRPEEKNRGGRESIKGRRIRLTGYRSHWRGWMRSGLHL